MLWIGRTPGIKNASVIIAGFAKVRTADILLFANELYSSRVPMQIQSAHVELGVALKQDQLVQSVKIGGIYQHYRGDKYKVIAVKIPLKITNKPVSSSTIRRLSK